MDRREFLAGAGVGVTAGLAGCLEVGASTDGAATEDHGTGTVIVDGVAYYGRQDGHVYAVDLESRRERWRYDAGDEINLSVDSADGIVYVATLDSRVVAVEMATGEDVWTVDWSGWFPFGQVFSPTVADGRVYFGTAGKGYAAVDAASGAVEWTFSPAAGPLFWKRLFSYRSAVTDGRTYVGADDVLYGFDAETGAEHGRFEAAGRSSSPTTADGLVCVGGAGVLHGLDAGDMTERWRVDVGEKIWFPAVEGDAVYVPDEAGTFAVVDVDTGRTRWTFETAGPLHTPPAFTDSTVFFGSHDGSLYAVDRETGMERWRYFVGRGADFDGVAAVPTVHDGLVYLAAPGHTLVALDAETGDVQSAFSHG